jgi:hypothetical protein
VKLPEKVRAGASQIFAAPCPARTSSPEGTAKDSVPGPFFSLFVRQQKDQWKLPHFFFGGVLKKWGYFQIIHL